MDLEGNEEDNTSTTAPKRINHNTGRSQVIHQIVASADTSYDNGNGDNATNVATIEKLQGLLVRN